jgi:hypothetical protein
MKAELDKRLEGVGICCNQLAVHEPLRGVRRAVNIDDVRSDLEGGTASNRSAPQLSRTRESAIRVA